MVFAICSCLNAFFWFLWFLWFFACCNYIEFRQDSAVCVLQFLSLICAPLGYFCLLAWRMRRPFSLYFGVIVDHLDLCWAYIFHYLYLQWLLGCKYNSEISQKSQRAQTWIQTIFFNGNWIVKSWYHPPQTVRNTRAKSVEIVREYQSPSAILLSISITWALPQTVGL